MTVLVHASGEQVVHHALLDRLVLGDEGFVFSIRLSTVVRIRAILRCSGNEGRTTGFAANDCL